MSTLNKYGRQTRSNRHYQEKLEISRAVSARAVGFNLL